MDVTAIQSNNSGVSKGCASSPFFSPSENSHHVSSIELNEIKRNSNRNSRKIKRYKLSDNFKMVKKY